MMKISTNSAKHASIMRSGLYLKTSVQVHIYVLHFEKPRPFSSFTGDDTTFRRSFPKRSSYNLLYVLRTEKNWCYLLTARIVSTAVLNKYVSRQIVVEFYFSEYDRNPLTKCSRPDTDNNENNSFVAIRRYFSMRSIYSIKCMFTILWLVLHF